MMDLEKIIHDLVERSAEWLVANNALIALRYSCEDAGGIIEDLGKGWCWRRPTKCSWSSTRSANCRSDRRMEHV